MRLGTHQTQSMVIGGTNRIFNGILATPITIGGTLVEAQLPLLGNMLPAGTPVVVDESTRLMTVHYAFEVYEAATAAATSIKVKKFQGNSLVKKDMCLGIAPSDIATTVASAKITAIDSSNEGYDILTISKALGALSAGDILVEVDKATAGTDTDAAIKVKPSLLTYYDVELLPYGTLSNIHMDAIWNFLDGEIFEKRISPIAPCVKAYMRSQGCVFRYSQI